MKFYIEVQSFPNGLGKPIAFPYFNKLIALEHLRHDTKEFPSCIWSLHEIDLDPAAGFQTVNITQINLDGSREADNYANLSTVPTT